MASRIYEPEGGAAPFRLAALVHALKGSGYHTTVLTSRPPTGERSSETVRRWPVLRDRAGAVRGYAQYASFDIPLLFRLFAVRKPSVVIVEPPPTTGVVCRIVCRLRRIPYVYFSADVASTAAKGIGVNRYIVAVLRRVESWVLRGAALVLVVSDGVRAEVISLGADPARAIMVGAGIDTERFSPAGPIASADYPYLVYAGTISEIQGAGIFVEAFGRIARQHPTARLKMFGHGVEFEQLRVRAQRLEPERIEFPGTVSGDDVARWLRGAHAGLASVRPDRGYDFAYATKAFASISCGTPVIYAGVGPARGMIRDNDLGWSVDWDAEQVAVAMVAALCTEQSVETRQLDRERLSRWVETNYSLSTVGAKAVAAINKLMASIDSSKPGPPRHFRLQR